jgi:DNA-directed RNA polymerase subunit E'/Rpb7
MKSNFAEKMNNEKKLSGVYKRTVLHMTVKAANMSDAAAKRVLERIVKENLDKKISRTRDGKCVKEGTIRPDSIRVLSFRILSTGEEETEYDVEYECMTCSKLEGVYIRSILSMKVVLAITEVGQNVKQNLGKKIAANTEGRCIPEGFIQPNSVKIMNYSAGNINGDKIEFQTVFECMVCHPVEGMLLDCTAKTITKAGVHAEVIDDTGVVPITVFIARDHHVMENAFSEIKEADSLIVQVIGVRFELNDPYICVIAKLK